MFAFKNSAVIRGVSSVVVAHRFNSISIANGILKVPDVVTIPFIEGDGVGPDIWRATKSVLDSAIQKAYLGKREIKWMEVLAGEKSFKTTGNWLPESTTKAFKTYKIGIRGPLTTPFSSDITSISNLIRKSMDLYCCIRPVSYIPGVPSPMKHPEHVNVVVFRETTEDVYAGIEFAQGSTAANELTEFLREKKALSKVRFPTTAAYGIKPISATGTTRLVKAAILHALKNEMSNVVLVHKGNIQKFTEGGFKDWGYNVAIDSFRNECVTERESWILGNKESGMDDVVQNAQALEPGYDMMTEMQQKKLVEEVTAVIKSIWATHGSGKWKSKLLVRDTIADITLQQIMTRAQEFDVIATMTLNGGYISDALAGQVGGVGMSPSENINFETLDAVFDTTHGTAPRYANLDVANPTALILSGELMFRHMGWNEAADLVKKGVHKTIAQGTVTYDLKRLMERESRQVTCSEFGKLVRENM